METNTQDTKKSQCANILAAMRRGESFTALEALNRFGSLSFAKRISQLVADGHPIMKEWETTSTGKRVIRYSFAVLDKIERQNGQDTWYYKKGTCADCAYHRFEHCDGNREHCQL